MLNIENEYHHDVIDDEEENPFEEEQVDLMDRDLPKRVYAFTSDNLLKEFTEGMRTSVDGTFKS